MSGVQSPDASTRYCNVAATQKHLKIWSKDDLDHDHTSFCGVFLMSNNVQIKRFKCERKKFLILTMTKFIFLPAISCYLLKHNLCHTYAVRIVPKVHSNHIWARFLGVSNSRDFWSVWGLFFSSRAYYLIHIYQLFFVGIWQWSHFLFLQYLLFFILVKYFPAGVWRLCASAKALHRRWVRGGRRAWTQSQAWGRFEHYNDDEDDGDDYEEEEEEELEPNPKLGAGKQGDDDEDDDDDDEEEEEGEEEEDD